MQGWTLGCVCIVLTPIYEGLRYARQIAVGNLLVCVLVVVIPWNERKRFVHDLYKVHSGMTVTETESVMGNYLKGPGAKWLLPGGPDPVVAAPAELLEPGTRGRSRVSPFAEHPVGLLSEEDLRAFTGVLTYRWSSMPSYDSDWGQVVFDAGRVVRVQFLPD